jgi:hypothetical protein
MQALSQLSYSPTEAGREGKGGSPWLSTSPRRVCRYLAIGDRDQLMVPVASLCRLTSKAAIES